MRLAILGYGAEGKSVEKYFQTHPYEDTPPEKIDIKVFDNFTDSEIDSLVLEKFDVIFRSPSVKPRKGWTSATNYFSSHCPAKIIGITGTKGKGTTCSMTVALLRALGYKTHLVGNIGVPALDVLDEIKDGDAVVYEMSSFQLWDLQKSPSVATILRIEPDHLNVHKDFEDYVAAKANIAKFQTPEDYTIHYLDNTCSTNIAKLSAGHKLTYPVEISKELLGILDGLTVPGAHNRENAEAALLSTYAFTAPEISFSEFIAQNFEALKKALYDFEGLPHRIEFVRELNHVRYYDDNYSTTFPSLDVALRTFEDAPTVLIAGGKDKGTDINPIKRRIFDAKNLKKAILIGETAKMLSKGEDARKYEFAETLEQAVLRAQEIAEENKGSVVLMSPGFASFDMFDSYGQRGDLFKKYVRALKQSVSI